MEEVEERETGNCLKGQEKYKSKQHEKNIPLHTSINRFVTTHRLDCHYFLS